MNASVLATVQIQIEVALTQPWSATETCDNVLASAKSDAANEVALVFQNRGTLRNLSVVGATLRVVENK